MSGIVTIELLLDPTTEARVRSDWESLADAGLSSLGARRAPSNRPHITLLVRPELAAVDFRSVVAMLPIPIMLTAPVVFEHGDRGVLAWRVELGAELREVHNAVRAAAPPGEDAAHTAPHEWEPHISLARRLRLVSLPDALGLIGPPFAGTAIALRRWDSASATVTELCAT